MLFRSAIVSSLVFAICTYNVFLVAISFFFPILIKDLLLALPDSNVFLLSLLYCIYLP